MSTLFTKVSWVSEELV